MALRDLDKTDTWIHTSEEKAGLDMKVLDGKQAKQSTLLPGWGTVLAWAALVKCRRLHGLNERSFLLSVLEAGKNKVKVPADLVPGKSSLADSYLLALS